MAFTEEEIKLLKQSPYVLAVGKTNISYGKLFYQEYWRIIQLGYSRYEAFDFLGLSVDILGEHRRNTLHYKVKEMANQGTLYDDSDSTHSIAEQLKQKDNEIERLRQEVAFLKKKKFLHRKYKT